MRSAEIHPGRQFALLLEPGEDVLSSLVDIARRTGIRQGYVPLFLGAFSVVEFIGTCRTVEDDDLPLNDSVEVSSTEGTGCASIAWDDSTQRPHVHLHAAVGLKRYAATAHAGHVVRAVTQYMCEVVIVEVGSPAWRRVPLPAAYGVPGLEFG